jgi:uncharacterized membrane protein
MKIVSRGLIWVLMLMFAGCYYDKDELLNPQSNIDCNAVSANYADVAPIISQKCARAGCHDAITAAGSTTLETYDQVKSMSSRINQRVIVEKTMPPGMTLAPSEIAILKCWISSGLPNN